MVMKRRSVSECTGSGMVIDRGSPKIVVAFSKATPCFARLDRALRESHSKVSGIKTQSVPDTSGLAEAESDIRGQQPPDEARACQGGRTLGQRSEVRGKRSDGRTSAAGRTSTTLQSMARSSAARFIRVAHSGSWKLRSTTIAPGAAACCTAANNRRAYAGRVRAHHGKSARTRSGQKRRIAVEFVTCLNPGVI